MTESHYRSVLAKHKHNLANLMINNLIIKSHEVV